jgi:hypothetical protein
LAVSLRGEIRMSEPRPYTLYVPDDDSSSYSVWFEEDTPWMEDRRIDILAEILAREPIIERAYREDREFINIEAQRGADPAAIEAAMGRAWVAAGGLVEPDWKPDVDLD